MRQWREEAGATQQAVAGDAGRVFEGDPTYMIKLADQTRVVMLCNQHADALQAVLDQMGA